MSETQEYSNKFGKGSVIPKGCKITCPLCDDEMGTVWGEVSDQNLKIFQMVLNKLNLKGMNQPNWKCAKCGTHYKINRQFHTEKGWLPEY